MRDTSDFKEDSLAYGASRYRQALLQLLGFLSVQGSCQALQMRYV